MLVNTQKLVDTKTLVDTQMLVDSWGNDLPERYDYYTVQTRIRTWVCRGMYMIEHQDCLTPLSHHGWVPSFFFILMEKGVKTPKKMVSTSKQLAKYLFAGQNSQQMP